MDNSYVSLLDFSIHSFICSLIDSLNLSKWHFWLKHWSTQLKNGSRVVNLVGRTFQCSGLLMAFTLWDTMLPVIMLTSGECMLSRFSHVRLFATLRTIARHSPLSMGFSRQEYWSGLRCPPAGDLPDPGTKPVSLTSPALIGGFFAISSTWQAQCNPWVSTKYTDTFD